MTEPSEKRGSFTLYPQMTTVKEMIEAYKKKYPPLYMTPEQARLSKTLQRMHPEPAPGQPFTDSNKSTDKK